MIIMLHLYSSSPIILMSTVISIKPFIYSLHELLLSDYKDVKLISTVQLFNTLLHLSLIRYAYRYDNDSIAVLIMACFSFLSLLIGISLHVCNGLDEYEGS